MPGLKPPTWDEVAAHDYHPWDRDRLVIDTANRTVAACVGEVIAAL